MQDKAKPNEPAREKLSDAELNNVSGGAPNTGDVTTSVSNVMKVRHDTVKNSISNVR
jgi:bacteriocin-like protein